MNIVYYLGTTTLALTSLSTVDITNSDLLVAIGKTCPFLKDVASVSPIRFIDSRIPHDGYHGYSNTQITSSHNSSPPCPFLQLEPYYTLRSPRWNDVFYDSDDSENDHWANYIGLIELSEIESARNDW